MKNAASLQCTAALSVFNPESIGSSQPIKFYVMKSYIVFILFFFPVLVSLLCSSVSDAAIVPLEQVLSRGIVNANVRSLGGNLGYCMEAELHNATVDTLEVYVEPGRLLKPYITWYQDIIVMKRQDFRLLPGACSSYRLYAFCCNYGKAAPKPNSVYSIGPMANDSLLKLCRFMNTVQLNESTVQQAVWVVSDHKDINGVYTKGDSFPSVMGLKRVLASITGQRPTPYMIEYRALAHRPWAKQADYLYLEDDYTIRKGGMVRVEFTDAKGVLVRELMAPVQRYPDNYKIEAHLYLNGLSPGRYLVRVFSGSTVEKEWEVFF
jgi:hypothetical protein